MASSAEVRQTVSPFSLRANGMRHAGVRGQRAEVGGFIDQNISIGRYGCPRGETVFHQVAVIVTEIPAADVNRAAGCVVKLNPVSGGIVRVCQALR